MLRLEMRAITKEFPGVRALDGVSFDLRPGEIHALVGENGAGKSTLMKVLSGLYPAGSYGGEILVEGRPARFRSIQESEVAGIAIIYQELALVKEMSLAENVLLGHEPHRFGIIDRERLQREASHFLAQVGLNLDPATLVGELGVGQQQLCEIAKALGRRAKILILDEPTAALTEVEVAVLMRLLEDLRQQGVSMIYISHKLGEVFSIADRITVLRDGRSIGTYPADQITEEQVIAKMVGREIHDRFPYRPRPLGAPVLEVSDLNAWEKATGRQVVRDLSLTLRAGEIVGLSGLMGAGRTELVTALFGGWPGRVTGSVHLEGRPLTGRTPKSTLKAGLALVSEDRKRYGLVLGMGVGPNLSLAALAELHRRGVIDREAEAVAVQRQIDDLTVKTTSAEVPVGTLSGGNQQKVVLGKMLLTRPKVLILDEPTRGVDVGAKYEIYKLILRLAESGMAILLVSSELPEVLGLSDRVLVMREGRLAAAFDRAEATSERVMQAATGRMGA